VPTPSRVLGLFDQGQLCRRSDQRRRSTLYATLATLDNRGALASTMPGGPAGMAAGGRSKGLEFGLRHGF
jgi:hypothetical protein